MCMRSPRVIPMPHAHACKTPTARTPQDVSEAHKENKTTAVSGTTTTSILNVQLDDAAKPRGYPTSSIHIPNCPHLSNGRCAPSKTHATFEIPNVYAWRFIIDMTHRSVPRACTSPSGSSTSAQCNFLILHVSPVPASLFSIVHCRGKT